MWEEKTIDLGFIKEDSKNKFEFVSIGELDIKDIKPGCGSCTTIKGYKNKVLTVVFKPGKIPAHLKVSLIPITKTIVVTYENDTKETLTFKAILKK